MILNFVGGNYFIRFTIVYLKNQNKVHFTSHKKYLTLRPIAVFYRKNSCNYLFVFFTAQNCQENPLVKRENWLSLIVVMREILIENLIVVNLLLLGMNFSL